MPTQRKVVVIGKQRAHIDPARMVHIIIALGRQMWEERRAAEVKANCRRSGEPPIRRKDAS